MADKMKSKSHIDSFQQIVQNIKRKDEASQGFKKINSQFENYIDSNEIKKNDQYQMINDPQEDKKKKLEKVQGELNLFSQSESIIQNSINPLSNLFSVYFQMKLKIFCSRLINKTKSRMFKNMTQQQYNQLNDISVNPLKVLKIAGNQKKQEILLNQEKFIHKPQQNIIKRASTLFKFQFNYIKQLGCWKQLERFFKNYEVIDPSSNSKLIWDIIIMVLSIIFIFVIPLSTTFECKLSFFASVPLTIISSFFFIIDIFVNMNTGYFEKGQLKTKKCQIFINYIKNSFVGDVIGGIYFFIHVMISAARDSQEQSFETREFLLLLFLMKISTFSRTLKRLEEISYLSTKQKNLLSLIKLIFIIIFIAHILSCLWMKIGLMEIKAGENSWLIKNQVNMEPWHIQYIESYYFNTVTMVTVGYGDIFPVTPKEQCWSIGIMIISCGVFAYSMNTVGMILNDFNSEELKIDQNMEVINKYMKKKGISKDIQYKIREYLDYYWREQSDSNIIQEQIIISQLSDILKQALAQEGNKIILKESKIFRNNFSVSLMTKAIQLIKEQRCTPEQIIFEEGDSDNQHIYFIQKGSVEFFIEAENKKILKILEKGKSFGELGFFTDNPRSISVRSREFTTLLMISRKDFLDLIKNFENDYESFCSIKDSLLLYSDYQVLGTECFSCLSKDHFINQCPYLHDIVKKVHVIRKFVKSIDQQRVKFPRRVKKYSNSLVSKNHYSKKQEEFQLANIENVNFFSQEECPSEIYDLDEINQNLLLQNQKYSGESHGNRQNIEGVGVNSKKSQNFLSIYNPELPKKHFPKFDKQDNIQEEYDTLEQSQLSSKIIDEEKNQENSFYNSIVEISLSDRKKQHKNEDNFFSSIEKKEGGYNSSNKSIQIITSPQQIPQKAGKLLSKQITPQKIIEVPLKTRALSLPKIRSCEILTEKGIQIEKMEEMMSNQNNFEQQQQKFQSHSKLKKLISQKKSRDIESSRSTLDANQFSINQNVVNCLKQSSNQEQSLLIKKFQFEEMNQKEIALKEQQMEKEFHLFEQQKNYEIYFPYNNLSYLLQLYEINEKQRSTQFRRIPFLNKLHMKTNLQSYIKGSKSPNIKNMSTMKQVLSKYVQEEQLSKRFIQNENVLSPFKNKDQENNSKRSGVFFQSSSPYAKEYKLDQETRKGSCINQASSFQKNQESNLQDQYEKENTGRKNKSQKQIEDNNQQSQEENKQMEIPKQDNQSFNYGNKQQQDFDLSCSLREEESYYLPPVQTISYSKRFIQHFD